MESPIHLESVKELKKEFAENPDFVILHIDDAEDLRESFVDQCAEFGVRVRSFAGPAEAMQFLKSGFENTVLIASDLRMPGMDGLQFRAEVLSLYKQIPFAIISGAIDQELAIKGIELRISAFLAKPVEDQELIQLLLKEALPRIATLKEDRELLQTFLVDGEALITEAEEILLKLEAEGSEPELLNRYYAIMHTLKGTSAFFEPKILHRFVHSYEEVLKRLQRGELPYSEQVTSVLFNGLDVIKELFQEFKSRLHQPRELEVLLKCLEFSLKKESVSPEGAAQAKKVPGEVGPSLSAADPGAKKNGVGEKAGTREDIGVSVTLLDEFMQLSGEVTVIRNMLNKCVSSIERRFAGDHDVGMLAELLSELHKINSSVQAKVSEIRKVPLKSVFRVLPRAVRDVARSLDKKIEFKIFGEELRVDTSIAEVLSNSLLHLIKNSIDHGIESPNARQKSGKKDCGLIQLEASVRDENVIVTISDDGKGLDVEAIKSRLVKNGSHTRAQVDAMDLSEIYSMIFSSGFSTAQQVTEISGRGVGMSMVKDCIEAIGGQIVIMSTPGKGATFQLELPVPKSVLIASCLGIKVGSQRLSLIQDDILRVIQLNTQQAKDAIRHAEKVDFLLFEGDLIPIARLETMMKLPNCESLSEEGVRRLIVMRDGHEDRRLVVEVSEILDVEDMVIKPLHPALNPDSLFRGVTFMDDGGVGLILSTAGMMESQGIRREAAKHRKQKDKVVAPLEAPSRPRKSALTVQIAGLGLVGLPQEYIFRIEEPRTEAIKRSGGVRVLSYRGSVLRVVSLSSVLGAESSKEVRATQTQSQRMVVAQFGERLIGIEVEEVFDVVECTDLKTDLASEDRVIAGHFFLGDKTVTLLDVEKFFARVAPSDGGSQLGGVSNSKVKLALVPPQVA